jgi:hypothetical protein
MARELDVNTRLGRTGKRLLAAVPIALSAALLFAAVPASASPTPTPAISKWSASPTTLSDAGGTVTFTGRFKFASTCKLSVTPRLKGLPIKSTCASNRYSKNVAIPKNRTGVALTYTFAFAVTNKTGTTDANNIVVGVGAAPPPISMSPTSFTFPAAGVGIPGVPQSVSVTNNSRSSQDISEISLAPGPDPADFAVAPGNCIVFLGPRQSCDFQLTFNPQSGGRRSETVLVADASWGPSGADGTLAIQGTGEFATASVSTTDLVFPAQGVDTGSSFTPITVTNSGAVPLHLDSLAVQGDDEVDFSLLGNTCSNAPGGNILSTNQSCTFEVQFTPSDSGTRKSTVIIDDNTPKATTTVDLAGTGDWTTSLLTLHTINFPATVVGDAVAQMVTIKNLSTTVSLTFNGAVITGTNTTDFTFVPNPEINSVQELCAATHLELGPGESCFFDVDFAPQNQGTRTAQLVIYDNSNNVTSPPSPQSEVISLSGTGEQP